MHNIAKGNTNTLNKDLRFGVYNNNKDITKLYLQANLPRYIRKDFYQHETCVYTNKSA